MGDAELRIVMAVVRKTFGYHKEKDRVSFSQFQKLTGLTRQGVTNGIKAALKRGVLGREESGNSFLYFLIVNDADSSEVVNDVDQSTQMTNKSQPSRPKMVNEVDTQKKKEIKKKQLLEQTPMNDLEFARVVQAYEKNIGPLAPILQDELVDFINDLSADDVIDAIRETRASGSTRWKYTKSILDRWKIEGRNNPSATNTHKTTDPSKWGGKVFSWEQ